MCTPEKKTYSQALTRLEEIVRQIDSQNTEIDRLADLIKEANALIAFCNEKLTTAEAEVGRLLTDETDGPATVD